MAGYQSGISLIFRKNSRGLGPKKYVRLIMIRVTWTLEKSSFQENLKILDLEHFRPKLKAVSPLPNSYCIGEACPPRSHYKDWTATPRSYIEGELGTSKLGYETYEFRKLSKDKILYFRLIIMSWHELWKKKKFPGKMFDLA